MALYSNWMLHTIELSVMVNRPDSKLSQMIKWLLQGATPVDVITFN